MIYSKGAANPGEKHKRTTELITVQQGENRLLAFGFNYVSLAGHVIKLASKAHLVLYAISLPCECMLVYSTAYVCLKVYLLVVSLYLKVHSKLLHLSCETLLPG